MKHSEQDQSMNEDMFRGLIENSLDVVMVLDGDGGIEYINSTVRDVLGYTPLELQGREVFGLLNTEDADQLLRTISSALNSSNYKPSRRLQTLRFQHKNGSWQIFEILSNKLENENAPKMSNPTSEKLEKRPGTKCW